MPRSVITTVGPPPVYPSFPRESPPSACPTEVTKASSSTNARFDCLRTIKTSFADAAISGAPPAPGRRTFGFS